MEYVDVGGKICAAATNEIFALAPKFNVDTCDPSNPPEEYLIIKYNGLGYI